MGRKQSWITPGRDNLGQVMPGTLVPRGPAALLGLGKDGTWLLLQQAVPPAATGKSAGSELWAMGRGVGAAHGPPGPHAPHLQSQGGRQHAAGGAADGEAQEEQDSPPQELHHEDLEGRAPRKSREAQEPQAPPDAPLPSAAFAGSSSPVPHAPSEGHL